MKVLIMQYNGSWLIKEAIKQYEGEIEELTNLLRKNGLSVQRSFLPPLEEDVSEFDAVIVICISFKKEAHLIKRQTGKITFIITGVQERGDDEDGVIVLDKSIGSFAYANIISQILIEKPTYLIRIDLGSITNRDRMSWEPLTGDEIQKLETYLSENPEQKTILDRGDFIKLRGLRGMLSHNIMRVGPYPK